MKDTGDRRADLLPHLVEHSRSGFPSDLSASGITSIVVRQGRLLRQVRRLQLLGLRDEAMSGLGDQLEKSRAAARRNCVSRGALRRRRGRSAIPFLPPRHRTHHRREARMPRRDVRHNAELRWPHVRFRTEPMPRSRETGAYPRRSAALAKAPRCRPRAVDVIVIARGGGDPQHAAGIQRRATRCGPWPRRSTPVVSAIGHENDHPLLDDVADLRASTPTDAAKRVVPDVVRAAGSWSPSCDPALTIAPRAARDVTTSRSSSSCGPGRSCAHPSR